MTRLADLTTMQVGGEPARLVVATTPDELLAAARAAFEAEASYDEPWFVLGGGSNTVASDDGFDGTVLQVATRGVEVLEPEAGDASATDGADPSGTPSDSPSGTPRRVSIRVAAGEPWDDLVAFTVAQGWSGLEALSGIPGSTGASPIQNIGAYGQEVAETLVGVDFLDAETGDFVRIPAANLELGYRTSVFKQGRRGVVTAVEFRLGDDAGLSQPVAFPQLATALGVAVGDRVPVAEVRARVLALRAGKGMVLDGSDRDTFSSGSFFTNPVVSRAALEALPPDAPRWETTPEVHDVAVPLGEQPAPPPPVAAPMVKLSAAWLIEHAGVSKGFCLPGSGAGISSKHTLALTNQGGATAEEVAELARYVQACVASRFGIVLQPEPVLLGLTL